MEDKLLNSRDDSRNGVILVFLCLGVFSILPILGIFCWEYFQMKTVRFLFNHLEIPSEVKYSLVFTYESLARIENVQIKSLSNSAVNISGYESYLSRSYNTVQSMNAAFETTFPSQFSTYTSLFDSLYRKDLCQTFDKVAVNCKNELSTILSKGATSSIYLLLTNAQQLYTDLMDSNPKDKGAQVNIFISPRMMQSEDVMVNTALVFNATISKFNDCMNSYLEYNSLLNMLLIALSVVFLLVLFLFCWRPYLNSLNKSIWRTKGMLNMIPMKAFNNNKVLKEAILNGDLIQAVK